MAPSPRGSARFCSSAWFDLCCPYRQVQYVVPPAPRLHEHDPALAVAEPIAAIKLRAAAILMALLSMRLLLYLRDDGPSHSREEPFLPPVGKARRNASLFSSPADGWIALYFSQPTSGAVRASACHASSANARRGRRGKAGRGCGEACPLRPVRPRRRAAMPCALAPAISLSENSRRNRRRAGHRLCSNAVRRRTGRHHAT